VVPFDGSRVKLRLPIIALCNLIVVVTSGEVLVFKIGRSLMPILVSLLHWYHGHLLKQFFFVNTIETIFNCDILECLY
jgi:NAD/NADP transhydrogenase beta subunit